MREAPTQSAHDATRLAREAVAEGADLVLVVGGDGTINEAANGLVGTGVPLCPLPGGTANVLCCEVGIGTRLRRAAAKVGSMKPRRIAVGRFSNAGGDSRHFLSMAGAGLDAHIVDQVSTPLKKSFGKLAYWVAGFGTFFRMLPEFDVELNGGRYRVGFALASRVRNYGGDLEIARGVSLLDPEFEVALFHGSFPPLYAKYFLGVLLGIHRGMKGIEMLKTKRLDFVSSNVTVQLDGEAAGRIPASVEIVPDALTLLIPEAYR